MASGASGRRQGDGGVRAGLEVQVQRLPDAPQVDVPGLGVPVQELQDLGLDAPSLMAAARDPATYAAWQDDTDRAIAAQVFGAPTWVVDGERFWGQDRLEFLEEKLVAHAAGR